MHIFSTLLSVAVLSVPAAGGALSPQPPQQQGRLMPPSNLKCDRSGISLLLIRKT